MTNNTKCKISLNEKEIEIVKGWFDFYIGDIGQPTKEGWKLAEKIGAYKPLDK